MFRADHSAANFGRDVSVHLLFSAFALIVLSFVDSVTDMNASNIPQLGAFSALRSVTCAQQRTNGAIFR
jgi:hypothetical protein